jgi:hypothetical protein
MKLTTSRFAVALLTSFAGLALSGTSTSTLANSSAPALTQAAPVQGADGLEVSSQRRPQGRRGGGGNVGRVAGGGGRQGAPRIGGGGRRGGPGFQGRIGRIDGRFGRRGFDGRVGFQGRVGFRYGRYGHRYGRVGRVGFVPIPVPIPSGPGPAPIQRIVPAAPCPVCPVQACLVAVFADPNLTGATFETADNQPRLDLSGWQNQISSIMVKSGTWDFYPEVGFRGPNLRLAPGSYGILEPQWTKRIGSYMCVR